MLWELLLVYIESIEIGYLIGISNKLRLKLIKGLKKKSNMSQLLATTVGNDGKGQGNSKAKS